MGWESVVFDFEVVQGGLILLGFEDIGGRGKSCNTNYCTDHN